MHVYSVRLFGTFLPFSRESRSRTCQKNDFKIYMKIDDDCVGISSGISSEKCNFKWNHQCICNIVYDFVKSFNIACSRYSEKMLCSIFLTRSWWNNVGTAKFLRACFSIIHYWNHVGASNWGTSLIKDTGTPWVWSANVWRSGQRAASQVYTSSPSIPRQSSDPSRKLVAKTLGYTYKLNRGISHDSAINLRNKQSEIILLSKFLALTRHRRKIVSTLSKRILPIKV